MSERRSMVDMRSWTLGFRLWNDSKKDKLQLSKGVEGLLNVSVFEGGGDLDAEAGLALGDDGKAEADDKDAEFKEAIAFGNRFGFVADHDGDDGGRRVVKVEAEVG